MSDELSVNPVSDWELKTVGAVQVLLLEFKFVSSPFQLPHEAETTPLLALKLPQARELAAQLAAEIQRVESAWVAAHPYPPL